MVPAPRNNNRAQAKGSSGRFRRLNALGNEQENPTTPKPAPEARIAPSNPAVDALHAKPFIIRTCQLKLDAESGREISEETGSILSQSLEKTLLSGVQKDAAQLTLAAFRKIVPGMSSYSKIHKFCTESGTIVQDESISIKEYLDLEIQGESGTIVKETAKSDEEGEIPEELNESTTVPNPPVKTSVEHSAASVKGIKLYFKSTTFAKKLAAPSELPTAPEINLETQEFATPEAELKPWEKDALIQEEKFEAANEVLTAATLDEQAWDTVLRGCAVFYGWIVDPRTRGIIRAPQPAFKLRSKVHEDPVASIPDFAEPSAAAGKGIEESQDNSALKATEAGAAQAGGESQAGDALLGKRSAGPATTDMNDDKAKAAALPEKRSLGLPNFRINDDSKIEVTVCKTEMMLAMARSDFSSQSTEASVSGGFGCFSASVSAGFASSRESASGSSSTNVQETMVARYMYPRCDLFLTPQDLEPSDELAELIEEVRKTKSIKALRKIHAQFGQLFCQNLTLGARLMSTKLTDASSNTSTASQKESFKTSVGASVSTPWVGVSAKHEQASGSASSNSASNSRQNESNVFEATGGDTILANNPPEWAKSVANPDMWRVINRDGLFSIIEMLAEMPGYEKVQTWFVRAVPALAKYISLDDGHAVTSRLKLTSPTNSLCLANTGNTSYYLGHGQGNTVTPRQNGISGSIENFWVRYDFAEEKALFHPRTYRAPVIRGFANYNVGGALYAAAYNKEFAETTWNIVAPFSEELSHGSLVILQTSPYTGGTTLQANGTDPRPPQSHMVVFRNSQGVFLPGMSDRDEMQYFRILKVGSTSQRRTPIKNGDEIRLGWAFKDQTTGFRDYKDDVFGRRQTERPVDVKSKVLYLKMPWPRFEARDVPNAMVMSGEEAEQPVCVLLQTGLREEKYKYVLQDVRFRIDPVPNGGRGDAEDYLLKGVGQEGDVRWATMRNKVNGMQMWSQMMKLGLA